MTASHDNEASIVYWHRELPPLDVALSIAEAPQATLELTKRYLSTNQGLDFEQSFRVEHDEVFDRVLRELGGAG